LGVEPHIRSKAAQTLPILPIANGQVLPALVHSLPLTKPSLQCCDEALKAGPVHWSQVKKNQCRWPLQGQGQVDSSLIVFPSGIPHCQPQRGIWLQRRTPIVPRQLKQGPLVCPLTATPCNRSPWNPVSELSRPTTGHTPTSHPRARSVLPPFFLLQCGERHGGSEGKHHKSDDGSTFMLPCAPYMTRLQVQRLFTATQQ